MDQTGKTLISLVRSALWGGPADAVDKDTDWNGVLLLAKQQTVLGLMAESVQNLPQELRPAEDILKKLKHHLIRNFQAHALLNRKLGETLELMRSHDIHPVLFKGQGLAQNYPNPLSRQCGDIDLYVGKDCYDKACNVAFDAFGRDEHASESLKHMHLDNDGVTIELHRIAESVPGLRADRNFQKWTRHYLHDSQRRKVEIDGVMVELPPVHFDAVYIMNHAWHHFVNGGIGMRQMCDWTLYIHRFHSEIDPSLLREELKMLGLTKVWHFFSWIAVNALGLPEDECPLYEGRYGKTAARVLDVILEEGNFGRYSRHNSKPRPKGYTEGKLHSFKVNTRRYFRHFGVYPAFMFKSWFHYVSDGIYHFVKDF